MLSLVAALSETPSVFWSKRHRLAVLHPLHILQAARNGSDLQHSHQSLQGQPLRNQALLHAVDSKLFLQYKS